MIKINCGLHGWSISNLLYPCMKGENTCAWFKYDGIEPKFNGDFCVGTRKEFLEYIKAHNVPLYRPIGDGRLYWVPYGLYRVRLDDSGFFVCGDAKGSGSAYVADKSDFLALAYASTGETDKSKLQKFIGTNPYKTACRLTEVKLPRYLDDYNDLEDNMFTRNLMALVQC
jgi:hypothetical protein